MSNIFENGPSQWEGLHEPSKDIAVLVGLETMTGRVKLHLSTKYYAKKTEELDYNYFEVIEGVCSELIGRESIGFDPYCKQNVKFYRENDPSIGKIGLVS